MFSMVLVFTEIIAPLREWGFQATLIYKKDIDEEYKSTAFWCICFIAMVLYLFSLVTAPFIGRFFNNPLVAKIIPIVSIGILFTPLASMQVAILTRDLNIRPIAIRNIFAEIMFGITACVLAFKGFGVWSFVVGTIVRELTWALTIWVLYKWRPLFVFNIKKFKEMFSYAVNCTGVLIVGNIINNIDNLLVGKFLGAIKLGFYNLAFNTVSHPQTKIASQISNVTFPAFSLIQEDNERMQKAYQNTTKIIMAVVIPFLAIIFVSAKEFVTVFYGDKWLPAVLPIQIMCFYGFIQAALSPVFSIFLSKGKSDLYLKIAFLRLILLFVILLFGVRFGINGVAASILLYSLLIAFPIFYYANKLLNAKLLNFLLMFLRYSLIYFMLIGIIWLASHALIQQCRQIMALYLLLFNIALGSIAYFILMLFSAREDLFTIFGIIKKVFR